jgi:hypothetical protein
MRGITPEMARDALMSLLSEAGKASRPLHRPFLSAAA